MKTLTTMGVGFVLGATLGFGGLYEYVLKPAKEEIIQLEEENGVMHDTLVEAQTTLEDEAGRITLDVTKLPIPGLGGETIESIVPGIGSSKPSSEKVRADSDEQAATKLLSVAEKIKAITDKKRKRD
ncbi:MAG: hypothetical protein ACYTDT_08995 [Planctomycetota bacterium]